MLQKTGALSTGFGLHLGVFWKPRRSVRKNGGREMQEDGEVRAAPDHIVFECPYDSHRKIDTAQGLGRPVYEKCCRVRL